jgi:hypothetical protein
LNTAEATSSGQSENKRRKAVADAITNAEPQRLQKAAEDAIKKDAKSYEQQQRRKQLRIPRAAACYRRLKRYRRREPKNARTKQRKTDSTDLQSLRILQTKRLQIEKAKQIKKIDTRQTDVLLNAGVSFFN